MERYDIAIIGTGPAGVSAAITAKIRGRKILLIGNNKISDKVSKAHIIKNYPGFIDITGKELSQAFNNHLKSLSIDITEDMVNAVYAMGKYFHIQGKKNNYEALTVILATGVDVTKPYAGEYENLGRGVSYCATCDAALYKEREAIVIGFNEEALSEAEFLAQTAKKVYYMPLYNKDKDINTLQAGKDSLKDNIDIIKGKPLSIERREDKMVLIMEDRELAADGIFVLRESMKPAQLVPGIKIEDNKVITDKSMASNIKGLYAAGDITGVPYQYVKAAGEGNAGDPGQHDAALRAPRPGGRTALRGGRHDRLDHQGGSALEAHLPPERQGVPGGDGHEPKDRAEGIRGRVPREEGRRRPRSLEGYERIGGTTWKSQQQRPRPQPTPPARPLPSRSTTTSQSRRPASPPWRARSRAIPARRSPATSPASTRGTSPPSRSSSRTGWPSAPARPWRSRSRGARPDGSPSSMRAGTPSRCSACVKAVKSTSASASWSPAAATARPTPSGSTRSSPGSPTLSATTP